MKLSRFIDHFKNPHPITTVRPLHCVFYSHIWTVYSLEELGLLNPGTDIILELATESNFAVALNPFNRHHENLLGLLQPDKHLHQLGAHFKDIPVPLVIAPYPVVSVNILLSALSLVSTDDSHIEKALVLVHINDAVKFASAYPDMNRFSIVWDVADAPNAMLPDLAQLLVNEQCLDEQRWGGIHLCNHKQRQLPNSDERTTTLGRLLDEYPFAKAV